MHFYQFSIFFIPGYSQYKIELINLINNSGSLYELINAVFHSYLFRIIIIKNEYIKLINIRQFSSDSQIG